MADLQWDRSFALEQAGDDEEMLTELLDLFRDSSESDLGKIKDGAAAEDTIQIAEAAHSIKGAAASLGIEGIRVVAADIEQAGRSENLAVAQEKIPALEDLLKQVEALQ